MKSEAVLWLGAMRLRTLPLSLAPILVGMAAAHRDQYGLNLAMTLALAIFSMLAQITCNFHNDLADFERGVDKHRKGEPRSVASGLITPEAMRRAVVICLLLALIPGGILTCFLGWWMVIIVATSLLNALAYTGGSWPFSLFWGGPLLNSTGSTGLADLVVFVYFGHVTTGLSYFISALSYSSQIFWLSSTIGILATLPLTANNLRDRTTDQAAAKCSLVVRLGDFGGRVYWSLASILGCLLGPLLAHRYLSGALITLGLPLIRGNLQKIWVDQQEQLDQMVKRSVAQHLLVCGSLITDLLFSDLLFRMVARVGRLGNQGPFRGVFWRPYGSTDIFGGP